MERCKRQESGSEKALPSTGTSCASLSQKRRMVLARMEFEMVFGVVVVVPPRVGQAKVLYAFVKKTMTMMRQWDDSGKAGPLLLLLSRHEHPLLQPQG